MEVDRGLWTSLDGCRVGFETTSKSLSVLTLAVSYELRTPSDTLQLQRAHRFKRTFRSQQARPARRKTWSVDEDVVVMPDEQEADHE